MPLTQHRQTQQRSFTLVEMVVAMGVLSMMMVMLFQLFGIAMKTWQQAEAKVDAYREARAALFVLNRDLGNLYKGGAEVFPTNLSGTLSYATNFYFTNLGIGSFYNVEQDTTNSEIYALTLSRNPGKSDICSVGFYCYWDNRYKAYMLKRHFQDSDRTYSNLFAQLPFFSVTNEAVFTPTGSDSATDDTLAPYVWDFRVSLFTNTTTGSGTREIEKVKLVEGDQFYATNNLPTYIEVQFKALSSAAAAKIAESRLTKEDWLDTNSPAHKNLILPHTQLFKTRIPVSGR